MFIPKKAVYQLGHWCEDYGFHAFEDTDYALRGEMLGYAQIFTTDVKHEHHLYEETSYIQKHGEEITNKNWALLRQNLVRFEIELQGGLQNIEEEARAKNVRSVFSDRYATSSRPERTL